ncbi:nucleoside monophosphate kinase [Streptomyces sp. Wb2n-11]|uniref:nucleoside monophosphate kinase n=1 Tax=Streptomyces sp. Wb2n-11 TaxID=1030533 RepID=UPI00350E3D5A
MEFTLELVRQLVGDDARIREDWRERWKKAKLHQRRAANALKSARRAPWPKDLAEAAPARELPLPPPELAERVLEKAREEAVQMLAAARSEAETLLATARAQAEATLLSAKEVLIAAQSEEQGASVPKLRSRKALRIVLVGPPASGKGTQKAFLSQELEIPAVHIGDLFRAHVHAQTELGATVKRCIESGNLIPDEVFVTMLSERLAEPDVHRGFILDGVPRSITQAQKVDELLALEGKKIDVALDLEIPNEEIFKRMAGRRICLKDSTHVFHTDYMPAKQYGVCDVCGGGLALRDADSRRVIGSRLELWSHSTVPVIRKYQTEGRLITISGLGKVRDVTERAIAALSAHLE